MKYLKRYNENIDWTFDEGEDDIKNEQSKKIIDSLYKGLAVKVKDFDLFFKILDEYDVDFNYIKNIYYPPDPLYFLLYDNRLFHTVKTNFGGKDLEYYVPPELN